MAGVGYSPRADLSPLDFVPTSEATPQYNCISWALGDPRVRWWPFEETDVTAAGFYWPDVIPRTESQEAFGALFEFFGFEPCADALLEQGYEKVALYALGEAPSHAAWQIVDGRWSSKVGSAGNDGIHSTPDGVGDAYGVVWAFYRRPRVRWSQPEDPVGQYLGDAPLGTVTVAG